MRNLLAVIALACLVGQPQLSFAQSATPETTPTTQPADTEVDKDIKKYEEKIKGLKKISGEFTFYQRKQEILLEIKENQLNKLFCIQATIGKGIGTDGLQAGDPLNQDHIEVFEFRGGPQEDIQLIKPNLKFRFLEDDALATTSARSIREAILENYTIEAVHPIKNLILINVTELFHGETLGVKKAISGTVGGSYMPDRQNFSVESIKSFPQNSVVEYNLHYKNMGGGDDGLASLLQALLGISGPPLADSRSLPFSVTYNMWFRRDTGYQPRLADPRVGYFTTDYFDVAKFNEVDRTTRLIQRFHLEKRDPSADLSRPIKPIVWILDPSIPEQFKQAVTDGILFWNKAFESAGFKNAIVVEEAKNDSNYNHADGRYNIVRWVMSESSTYAVAWFRPDPITGEIINAAVTVDANYPASAFTEFKEEVAGSSAQKLPWADDEGKQNLLRQLVEKPLAKHGFRKVSCDHARGLAEHSSFAYNLMLAKDVPVDRDEYVNKMIADLIAHEVGHCLGLRHNFAASTYKTTAELANYDSIKESGVAASVMDYVPLNLVAILKGHQGYYNPTVGPYDLWAIQYGYSTFNAPASQESYFLNDIAKKYGQPGLLFLTDEDAEGLNPLSVLWDIGSDLTEYLKISNQANSLLRDYAINRATQPGESYSRRNSLILRSIRSTFRGASMAAREVGGIEFRRHLKGDDWESPTLKPVDANRQLESMKFICSTALSMDSLQLPQDVLMSFSQDPNAGGSDYNAPLRNYVSRQQMLLSAQLLSADKLDSISENEFKVLGSKNKYTLNDHFSLLCGTVFSDASLVKSMSPLKRDLQRFVLSTLISLSESQPGILNADSQLIAGFWVEKLKGSFTEALKSKNLDQMTQLHLKAMLKEIDSATETDKAKTS